MNQSCLKVSNNKYFNCPARMDDGRQFTDYRPRDEVNADLMNLANARTNFQYRNYLESNAVNIIKANFESAYLKNSCNECNAVPVPPLNICKVDIYNQSCQPYNLKGLGNHNVATNAQQINTPKQLENKINEFEAFNEINFINFAAAPGINAKKMF
jgi:hypothetical protein